MNLPTNHKLIYEKAAALVSAGVYKLIYEKAGRIYGCESGIPNDNDQCLEAFDKSQTVDNIKDSSINEEEENPAAKCEASEEVTAMPSTKRSRKSAKAAVVEEVVEEKLEDLIAEVLVTEENIEVEE